MRGPVFALALALVAGCATPPHPPPGRLPEPADLTGSWLSNWGAMALRQDGAEVTGTYEHRSGRLQGRVDGDLLLFEWEQPGSRVHIPVEADLSGSTMLQLDLAQDSSDPLNRQEDQSV